jgi:cell division protein FtsL
MAAVQHAGALPGAAARRLPWTLFAALALLVAAGLGLLQVLQTSRAATAGYELRALERERAELAAEVRLLETDVAAQARTDQVQRIAVERLGMVPPERAVRVTVAERGPAGLGLPPRYVVEPEPLRPPSFAWWETLLRRVPGFD